MWYGSGNSGYLLNTPNHVMVDVGSDANFSCQSSIPNRISWSLIDLAGRSLALNATIVLQSITYVSILLSADQKTSTVTLHAVEKQFSGTIRCADTHQAAFADLTVLGKWTSTAYYVAPIEAHCFPTVLWRCRLYTQKWTKYGSKSHVNQRHYLVNSTINS